MQRNHPISMTCSFDVETDPKTFADRIMHLTRFIYLEDFHTPEGFITLQTPQAYYTHQADRPHVISIAGRYYTLTEYAGTAHSVSKLLSLIWFVLNPTRAGTSQATAACSEPAVADCFKGLLLHLWRHHPEARPGIERSWPAVAKVASHPVAMHHFDQDVGQVLSKYPECTSTRQGTDATIQYTIYHDDTELGWIKRMDD